MLYTDKATVVNMVPTTSISNTWQDSRMSVENFKSSLQL